MPEGIQVNLIPEGAGVDSLTRQIRQTGRAYPLFDIGHLILKRPDRYVLEFKAVGNLPDGTPRQLVLCNLDDSVWLTEGDAIRHILQKHFDTFYQVEKIPVDPPKGTYTFVAQCGMSGTILGPPNLHDYQAKLQRLHAERFSRLPFDQYKSRVRIVRDEAVVKQWIEEQSFKFQYHCLNLPEPLTLPSREAVEKHFREVHSPNIIRRVNTHTARTPAAREALPPPLRRLARREFDLQQRFPLKLVTRLADDFAHRGLHFFKVNRTVLHVSVARPRYLDFDVNPVSDGVRKIMETIRSTPKCTRRKLLESLGIQLPEPGSAAPAAPVAAPAEAPATDGGSGEAVASGAAETTETTGTTETAEQPSGPVAAPAPEAATAISPELQAIITDLHWLIHEGHVIEYSSGIIEAAKKPAPRPQPAPRPAAAKASAPPVAGGDTASEAGDQGEGEGGAESEAEAEAEVDAEATAGAGGTDQAAGTLTEGTEAVEGSDLSGKTPDATEPSVAGEATVEGTDSVSAEAPTHGGDSAPPVAGESETPDDALRSNPS